MRVVLLQHQQHLLSGSIQTFSANLEDEDEIDFGGGSNGSGR